MSHETKSPFELRLDMIAMSKELLEKQFEVSRKIIETNWNLAVETARAAHATLPAFPAEMMKYPTYEEIVELAKKMNIFVSGK